MANVSARPGCAVASCAAAPRERGLNGRGWIEMTRLVPVHSGEVLKLRWSRKIGQVAKVYSTD